MSLSRPDHFTFAIIGLVTIFSVLWGIITWIIRISYRLRKVEPPKLKFMFAIAFLQILLGILTIYVVDAIMDEPLLYMGTGLGITILSGLLFIKLILKNDWNQSLRIWTIAASMQLVFVPVCSVVMLVGWFILGFILHIYTLQF
jgi:type IV secretory pathway TrbD component